MVFKVSWEPDPDRKGCARAVVREGGRIFRTASIVLSAHSRKGLEQWEHVLKEEVWRFFGGRGHNLVQHDPVGEPDVWTRPGML